MIYHRGGETDLCPAPIDMSDPLRAALRHYAQHPEQIECRLQRLRGEVDLERVLTTGLFGIALVGGLGTVWGRHKGLFRALAITATAFRLQLAARGRCPPATLLRRFGLRRRGEIDLEYHLLRVLRGDHDPALAAGYHRSSERLPMILAALDEAASEDAAPAMPLATQAAQSPQSPRTRMTKASRFKSP